MAGRRNAADDGYDTDTISLTSTLEDQGEADELWDVEDILAEVECQDDIVRYLVKWDGFGWHECTWEPYEHIADSSLPLTWQKRKDRFTKEELTKYMDANISRWETAQVQHEADKALRKEKRAKRREKVRKGVARKVARNAEKSDDDVPLATRQKPPSIKRTSREQTEDALFVRETRPPRRPPLEQSSSSSSQGSDDSMMAEIRTSATRRETQNPTRSARTETRRSSLAGSTALSVSAGRIQSANSRATAPEGGQKDNPRRLSAPTITSSESATNSSAIVNKARELAGKIVSSTTATPRAPVQPGRDLPPANRALSNPGLVAGKPAVASIRRSAQSSTAGPAPGPIKMVNQAPTSKRSPWQNSDQHYNRVSIKRKAELRSRNEKAPDLSVLDFVHGTPVLPKASTTAHATSESRVDDNPYGRREVPNRRIQNEEPEKRPSPPPPAWEADKVPLTCWEWRNGSCQYGAERCRFLHRDTPHMAPLDGHVPEKFWRLPVTCWYYMKGPYGCAKSEAQCDFAHWNTGRLASMKKSTGKLQPRAVTCYFWNLGTCNKPAEDCIYAHEYTGVMAKAPPGHRPKNATANSNYTPIKSGRTFGNDEEHSPASGLNSASALPSSGANATPVEFSRRLDRPEAPPPLHTPTPKSALTHDNVPASGTSEHAPEATDDNNLDPGISARMDDVVVVPPNPPAVQSPAQIPCPELKRIIEDACNLDFSTIFCDNHNSEIFLERRAFLIFHPEDHMEEVELMTRWLLMHHVEVCGFWMGGSWEYFKQKILAGGSGVILAHPDLYAFWTVPDFGRVLRHNVRVWSVGYQPPSDYDQYSPLEPGKPRYDCIEIFPHGGFIYITDEVFEKQPIEALKLISLFTGKVDVCRSVASVPSVWRNIDNGCLFWRLITRPELKDTTYKWCEAHEAEVEGHDSAAQSRAKLYALLSHGEYIEQDDPGLFIMRAQDYWPIISERKEVSDTYYEALARSQEDANQEQLQLYCEVLVDLRKDYRHFFVVHTEPSKVDWQSRWQNIDEIMTPEKMIEYLEQPSKGNRLDFHEWRFPKKKQPDTMDVDIDSDMDMTGSVASPGSTGAASMDLSDN